MAGVGASLGLGLIGSAGLALIAQLLAMIDILGVRTDPCFGAQVASTAGTMVAGPFVAATGLAGYIGWAASAILAAVAFYCG